MLFKVEDTNRIESLTDFVDTTSSLCMGLSVGCARCHDHKFDPISHKDYFKLQAIFAPAVEHRIFLEYNSVRALDINENYRQFKLRDLAAQIARTFGPYNKLLKEKKKAGWRPVPVIPIWRRVSQPMNSRFACSSTRPKQST